MTDTTQPAIKPDMLIAADELLRRFQSGEELTNWDGLEPAEIVTGESAYVIAAAVLAVAGELRSAQLATAEDLTRIVYALERIAHRLDAVTIGPDSVTVRQDPAA